MTFNNFNESCIKYGTLKLGENKYPYIGDIFAIHHYRLKRGRVEYTIKGTFERDELQKGRINSLKRLIMYESRDYPFPRQYLFMSILG